MRIETELTLKIGIPQIIGWGSGFYLPAILAVPISRSLGIGTEVFFWAFTLCLLVASVLGPLVGKTIDRIGGRRVLPLGNLAFALGLVLLSFAQGPVMLFIAWGIIGVGASLGNYDSAFATAVRFLGTKSNSVIAGITVFGGVSSTIAWPLTSYLNATFDWRLTVLFWAAMHLVVSLPIHLSIPKSEPVKKVVPALPLTPRPKKKLRFSRLLVIFSVMFALEGFVVASVNSTMPFLLTEVLDNAELALFAAVLLGPSQVFARVLLVVLSKVLTPFRVAAVSLSVHPLGVVLLLSFGEAGVLPFVFLHGFAAGLDPFIRGSLPLLFFGSVSYGERQGYLMMLSKLVAAVSPVVFTILVLTNPQFAIMITMSLGLLALLGLGYLSRLYRLRETTNLKVVETPII